MAKKSNKTNWTKVLTISLVGVLFLICLNMFLVSKNESNLNQELVIPTEVVTISAPIDNNILWKKFVSKDLFEIQYPSSWSIKQEDQTFQQGDLFNVTLKVKEGCSPGDQCYNGASVAIKEIKEFSNAKDYLSGIINYYPESERIKVDPNDLMRKSVYWVEIGPLKYLHYNGCSINCYEHYLLEYNSKLYDVVATNQAEDYVKYDKMLKQILSSLTFY